MPKKKLAKIPYASIVMDPAYNHRAIDPEHVDHLAESIRQDGLGTMLTCFQVIETDKDGDSRQVYKISEGFHRWHALEKLRTSVNADDIDAFDREAPGGKIEVFLAEGAPDIVRRKGIIDNTYRKNLTPQEVYAEVVRQHMDGQDQREIASVLNIQQPRVNEFLSFRKCIADVHDAWKANKLAVQDMIKFAALSEDDQEAELKAFLANLDVAGGKKATARKNLKKAVKEKGGTRTYQNAGKPTRQKLASYVPRIAVYARTAKSATARTAWDAMAAAFKIINGELDFEKFDPEKTYVTEKDAKEAQKLIDAEAEKAAKKAERAKAKAAKAKKAEKTAKEGLRKTAKKKAEKAAKPGKAKAEKPAKTEEKAAEKTERKSGSTTAETPKKPSKKSSKKASNKAA